MRELFAAIGLGEPAIAHYRHWESDVEADISYEAERLRDKVPDLVVAKSLGTLIAVSAYCLHSFQPRTAVLIGVPLCNFSKQQLQLLQRFSDRIPTLFVQQSADPGASYAELQSLVRTFARSEAAEISGDDHAYTNTAELVEAISTWWAKVNPQQRTTHHQSSRRGH